MERRTPRCKQRLSHTLTNPSSARHTASSWPSSSVWHTWRGGTSTVPAIGYQAASGRNDAIGDSEVLQPAPVHDRGLVGLDRRLGVRVEREALGDLVLEDRLVLAEDQLLEP